MISMDYVCFKKAKGSGTYLSKTIIYNQRVEVSTLFNLFNLHFRKQLEFLTCEDFHPPLLFKKMWRKKKEERRERDETRDNYSMIITQ